MFGMLLTLLFAGGCGTGADGQKTVQARARDGVTTFTASSGDEILVATGTEAQANAYYRRIAIELDFPDLAASSIAGLLDYCGFGGLDATDLQGLESGTLMDPSELPRQVTNAEAFNSYFRDQPVQEGEILAARFFAPKIINLTNIPSGSEDYEFGWRKLIRLKARENSRARQNGIASCSVLFNFLARLDEGDPFRGNSSANNQVMLVRDAFEQGKDPAYWLVYDEVTNEGGGALLPFLTAFFELPDRLPPGERYYVPNSCADCHGANPRTPVGEPIPNGKLNYLDTDHWFDRVQEGNDFSALRGRFPVLFDAQTDDPADPKFKRAFQVFRLFNEEVRRQNEIVDASNGSVPSLQSRGAAKWISLHPQGNAAPVPPVERGLAPRAIGDLVWERGDEETVGMLNQYCFRCHSSIRFSVFDKEMVKAKAGRMSRYIDFRLMPQDRTVSDAGSQKEKDDLKRLSCLLRCLDDPTQPECGSSNESGCPE